MSHAADGKLHVLVVGQTPPPFGGQAVMIGRFLEGTYRTLRLRHVRMAFSREMDEIGRFGWGKVVHMFAVILRVWAVRLRHRVDVLYYPPAGPNRTPMLRDLVILTATRWLFRRTVFHFHAGGVSDLLATQPWPVRVLARLAYGKPDVAIALSPLSPPDGERLAARQVVVVPNGTTDEYPTYAAEAEAARADPAQPPRIMFVGVVGEPKGAMVLLQACARLAQRDVAFHLDLVGKPESPEFLAEAQAFIRDNSLSDRVSLRGVLTGADKWRAYAAASVFAFPSHFDSENLPVVILEASQFALPTVATHWRGIPTLVADGETGLLTPTRDPAAVAARLEELLTEPAKRAAMGARARESFLAKYTLDKWCRAMEDAVTAAVAPPTPANAVGLTAGDATRFTPVSGAVRPL